nr:unnamed protein product [Callosobruchus chinensis]
MKTMTLPAAMVLSGMPREHFGEDFSTVFDQGTVLLKSPNVSSTASFRSAESGFSSLSSIDSMERGLDYYLDVIDKLEERFKVTFFQSLMRYISLFIIIFLSKINLHSNENVYDV